MKFYFMKDKTNQHGTQKKGEMWNGEMRRGWKVVFINLRRGSPGYSKRMILYFPDGSWWYFDVFSKGRFW